MMDLLLLPLYLNARRSGTPETAKKMVLSLIRTNQCTTWKHKFLAKKVQGFLKTTSLTQGDLEVDSFNEDEMILEGYEPPTRQPGVTWYVRKHKMKEIVDVDNQEDELTVTNKATAEERAFLQSIDKEEEEQKKAAKTTNSESN